jgi:nucleoside phosphorylase
VGLADTSAGQILHRGSSGVKPASFFYDSKTNGLDIWSLCESDYQQNLVNPLASSSQTVYPVSPCCCKDDQTERHLTHSMLHQDIEWLKKQIENSDPLAARLEQAGTNVPQSLEQEYRRLKLQAVNIFERHECLASTSLFDELKNTLYPAILPLPSDMHTPWNWGMIHANSVREALPIFEIALSELESLYASEKLVLQPELEALKTDADSESQIDFAIITALEKEAKAVVGRLEDHRSLRFEDEDIRTYHYGTIPIQRTDQEYHVVVVLLPSMGNVSAASAVTDTIMRSDPRFVLMVGIAGGIPQDDLDLGDVVVADQIVGYEYGKVTDQGIEPRVRVYPASALLLDRVRNFWDDGWTQQVKTPRPSNAVRAVPRLFVGPTASGNKVIASTKFRQQLTTHWPKLIGLEMEGEGVFAAVFDRPQIPGALVIRGICDMADERKSDEWQEYAANAAAAFTVSFLKSGPVKPQQRRPR